MLEGKDLDANALQDLKTKGMSFKYTVLENNKPVEKEVFVKFEDLDEKTRQLVEFKLVQKKRENLVSKLSVLRMLIDQKKTH